jgi:FkbM family methyltransferase
LTAQNTLYSLIDRNTLLSALQALTSPRVSLAGMQVMLPGAIPLRLSMVLSNVRMQRLFDTLIQSGDTVVDVGANIGYNTLYASQRVGPTGRVYAFEPTQDNLVYLYANLLQNHLTNVAVLPFAAAGERKPLQFYIRGNASAVNSLYADNFYHPITRIDEVLAVPLDEIIAGTPSLVKIDVEGGELAVLDGMSRLLQSPNMRLIVEWHPTLQAAAGFPPDALPKRLREFGFQLDAISHFGSARLTESGIQTLCDQLLRKRSPVELLATR